MDKVLKAVYAIIEGRLVDQLSLEGLTEIEADLITAVTAMGVIGNGGFYFWCEGKDAAATSRAAMVFERVGLPEAAETMRASLAAFPGNAPPKDLLARGEYLSQPRQELEAEFASLDRKIWDTHHDAAAKRFVDRNRAALVAICPAYAALLRLQQQRYSDRLGKVWA